MLPILGFNCFKKVKIDLNVVINFALVQLLTLLWLFPHGFVLNAQSLYGQYVFIYLILTPTLGCFMESHLLQQHAGLHYTVFQL